LRHKGIEQLAFQFAAGIQNAPSASMGSGFSQKRFAEATLSSVNDDACDCGAGGDPLRNESRTETEHESET
jgi:hypothetical protein